MLSILVKDYMQSNVQAIPASASVREVVEHLLKWNVTGAPVVDQQHRLADHLGALVGRVFL